MPPSVAFTSGSKASPRSSSLIGAAGLGAAGFLPAFAAAADAAAVAAALLTGASPSARGNSASVVE
jgi:hypothetical protein